MKSVLRVLTGLAILFAVGVFAFWPQGPLASPASQRSPGSNAGLLADEAASPALQASDAEVIVSDPVTPTLTLAARDLPPSPLLPTLDREINPRMTLSGEIGPDFDPPNKPDPLLEVQAAAPAAQPDGFDTPLFNFNGQGYTFVNPPDTVGDIGKDHYIQMINATRVAIYDKTTGALVIPTFDLTALGGCATGSGDPVVLYDQLADRWLLSEFGSGSSLCVFVSQTPDPTGAYYSYQFSTPSFPDYPKYGVWPDAYYVTTNESSPAVYAFNRTAMLAGTAATSQRFIAPGLAGFSFEALTPSDLDGMAPPPPGAPNYVMRHVDTEAHSVAGYPSNDILEIWAFSVNWTTPALSTFSKIADILTAEFDSTLCGLSSFYCMGMPGVAQGSTSSLDPLREVIMHRLGYRNFGDHEALVGNFVTDIGSNIGGVRWFELRKVGAGAWSLYQEGTYAPTTTDNRWMGGIAMDGAGNIALGYNVSSQTVYPSLRYVGRLAADPLGTLPQGEYTLVNGSGVNGSNRYGDYAAMGIDPIDDCTFWFTGMYNASSQWSTRIGAFKFDACGAPDFTFAVAPDSQDICVGSNASYAVTIGSISGYNDPVTLSTLGNPGAASFSVNPVTPPGNSTLTISGAAAGTYIFDVVGAAAGPNVSQETVGLTVQAAAPGVPSLLTPANNATNVSTTPTFTWNAVAQASSYSIQIATDPAFANIVHSASGLSGTSYTLGAALDGSTLYFWRLRADNACGSGSYSSFFRFTTVAAAGDCAPGSAPNVLLSEGFEAGAGGWTHSGTGDTWSIWSTRVHSGVAAFHGNGSGTASDQRLVSPAVALPTGQSPLSLKFWNYQWLEDRAGGCYDGGILEVSTNGGLSWTQITSGLLTDPYDGPFASGNPLGTVNAWCGDPQDWLNSIVDLDAYAGQSVRFRFRLGTDTSVSREGWTIDDVAVQSCQPVACTAPASVTGVTISDIGNDQVQLTWSPVVDAVYYEVWSAVNDPYFTPGSDCSTPGPYACAYVAGASYTTTVLGDPGDNHSYLVRAANACGAVSTGPHERSAEFEFDLLPSTP